MTTFIIAQLTFRETQRRRILWLALLMGVGFLAIFWLGFRDILRDLQMTGFSGTEQGNTVLSLTFTAGLYVVNFLMVMMTVLTSVTAVSGEIDSHTIETLLTKPVRRWEIILGKWLGFAVLLLLYMLLMTGGVIFIVYRESGYAPGNLLPGLGMLFLEGLLVLSLTLAGGTRLSTLANGVLAFMLYGIGFIGGWVEQIGALLRNETAVDIGILTSLIMPTEVLWRKAIIFLQPSLTDLSLFAGPFVVTSQPSDLMIGYAVGYTAVLLLLAVWSFSQRDL